MQPTYRYWELLGVAGLVAASAVLFERPILLAGTAGIAGWLVAMQAAFVMSIADLDTTLTVDQSLTQSATLTEEPVPLTLGATGDTNGLDVAVELQPPAGVEIEGTETVPLGETTVVSVRSSIAGQHAFRPPVITIADTWGLFTERVTRGPSCDLTVQPREPKQVHIGEGGDTIPMAFGEHAADTGESGLIPAELREYTGGESLSRIDWNATARLATPYVRDFEAESDVTTIVLVDRRGRLAIGPPGVTAFAYLRSAALSYLTLIESLSDPIGYFTIADEHIEQQVAPTNTTRGYGSIRRHLQSIDIETATQTRQRPVSLRHRSPMLDRATEFGRTLATYTTSATATRNADPLPAAIRRAVAAQQGTVQLAVFTDDSDHAELRDAVTEAKRANAPLNLFLAPRSLYEAESRPLTDIINERYHEFEQFRRQLAAIEGVRAYEVAPQERIERVLDTQRTLNAKSQ